MRKVLLYSGGFDSTLMLADLMRDAREEDEIIAVSVIHNLTGMCKHRREYESQILCIRELKKRFPKARLTHEIIRVESMWNIGSTYNCKGLAQPIFWMCNIIPLLEDGDAVYTGYIKGDDAMEHLDELYQMWHYALKFQDGKDVCLKLPHRHKSKEEIIVELIANYDYLVDHCVSCESEVFDGVSVCGDCVPCKHLKSALVQIIMNYSDNDLLNRAKQLLKDKFDMEVQFTSGESKSINNTHKDDSQTITYTDEVYMDVDSRETARSTD